MQSQPFDISSLHTAYAGGLNPGDVIEESYRRIEAVDDPGIFLHLIDRNEAITAVKALGSFDPLSKPLWGIPFAIKDNIDSAGAPTTAACADFAFMADDDAFVVSLLRKAGAILIGKTNLDQFATGLVGVRSPYPIPRNAIDPEIVPGGSSSGSSVAVSHGIVSFALGTDTAGSGRVPAALNNIVGLKPSLGALSNTGVVPACRSLDTISIFALTVSDAWRVFQSAAKFDPADSYSRKIPAPDLGAPPPAFRVGVPDATTRHFFGDDIQAINYLSALSVLTDMGAEIIEIDFQPLYQIAEMLYGGVWVAERYAAIDTLIRTCPEKLHPTTREVIEAAEKFDAVDTFKSIYRLKDLKRQMEPILAGTDILCVPTIPTFASVRDLEADPITPNSRLGTYTNFVNLMDMCGIAVPVAPRQDGRPGNVTLLAPTGQDALVASIATHLHQNSRSTLGATGWAQPAVLLPADKPQAGEIAIAVVGAHMSGLPLNHEITRLGGRFLRQDKTQDTYSLYSLPGGPPTRPGLVRTGKGAEILLEIWALPITAFGAFIAGVPHPLGIGTLILANGDKVKGFLCEQYAVQGAEDVTRFGGWRTFLEDQSSHKSKHMESSHA